MGAATWTGATPQLPICLVTVEGTDLLREPDNPLVEDNEFAKLEKDA